MIAEQVLLDEWEAGELAVEYDDQEPQEVIGWALDRFGPRIAICTALQIDGMAILDMAWRIDPRVRVFTVDTGRLPEQTHDLLARVRARYGIEVDVRQPERVQVEKLIAAQGPDLFYKKGVRQRLQCCEVRKVNPLLKALNGLDAWITGLRRDQWATRSNIRKIEIDHDHGGVTKVNPLADWTEDEVWEYVRAHDVPYNALYDQGYKSIGCAPCTRPVPDGADARQGRWWWEAAGAPKECGMHCAIETGGFEHEAEVLLHTVER